MLEKVVVFADKFCYNELFNKGQIKDVQIVNLESLNDDGASSDLSIYFKGGKRSSACLCLSKSTSYDKLLNGQYNPTIYKLLSQLSSLSLDKTTLSLFIVLDSDKEIDDKDDIIQKIEDTLPIMQNIGRCYGIDIMWFGMDTDDIRGKIYDTIQINSFRWLDPSSGLGSIKKLQYGGGIGLSTNYKLLYIAIIVILVGIIIRFSIELSRTPTVRPKPNSPELETLNLDNYVSKPTYDVLLREFNDLKGILGKLESSEKHLQVTLDKKIARIQELEDNVEKLESSHKQEIHEIDQTNAQKIKDLKDQHATAIQKIDQNNQQKMTEIKDEQTRKIKEIADRYEQDGLNLKTCLEQNLNYTKIITHLGKQISAMDNPTPFCRFMGCYY